MRRAAGGQQATAPTMEYPAELHEAETVGVVYDEVDGLFFCANFGLVEAAFANPDLITRPMYRHVVLGYLEDDSILPLP